MIRPMVFLLGVSLATALVVSGGNDENSESTYRSASERKAALGPTQRLTGKLQWAFDPEGFTPLAKPASGEWLDAHPERGQTFQQFLRARKNTPNGARKKIYLLPVGDFDARDSRSATTVGPNMSHLRRIAAAFFGLETVLLPQSKLKTFTSRRHPTTKKRQFLTGDILAWLKGRVPPDAYCLIGFTVEDLYPSEDWNFVFGQASLVDRVGIYSFARYNPEPGPNGREVLLRRSAKVMTHELAHTFGLAHCVFYECLVNGSNHLQESDSRPFRLCPICLRKLYRSIGFDPIERYKKLQRVLADVGLKSEAQWIGERLKFMNI